MAHYAFLDENNIVTEVIVGNDETTGDWETYYGELRGQKCVRTSYNGNIRARFAGIGFRYDETLNVFIRPQPFASWVLDANGEWQPPTPKPNNEGWAWDEDNLTWIEYKKPDGFPS